MAEPLTISTQGTPNPNAAKFTLNRTVATQGATYRLPAASKPGEPGACLPSLGDRQAAQADDAATAEPSWAKQLLAIPGVTQVFAVNDFISVTKRPEADWDQVGPQVEGVLRQVFA